MFHFKTLKELLNHFADEKTCRDFLEEKYWQGGAICPYCGSMKVYRLNDGKRFKCGNKKTCDRKFSVTVGTIFENTKIPLSTWFAAIYLTANHKKGISSLQLHRDLGVTAKTAWFMLHRIRYMLKQYTQVTLSDTVQVDETYVQGKKRNRSKKERARIIKYGWTKEKEATVIGLIDKENLVLRVVTGSEKRHVMPVIREVVPDTETLIVTDASALYFGLENTYKGRIIINHAKDEYQVAQYHTNSVEGVFSWFKRTIFGTYHYVSKKHMQAYCTMFSFRFNTRKMKECERFDAVFTDLNSRLTYPKLIGIQNESIS
jgi:transposase-like protein